MSNIPTMTFLSLYTGSGAMDKGGHLIARWMMQHARDAAGWEWE